MNGAFARIVTYLFIAIVLYFAFTTHILLGIVVLVGLIGITFYRKRDVALMQKAIQMSNAGNYESALTLFEQAYRINPNN